MAKHSTCVPTVLQSGLLTCAWLPPATASIPPPSKGIQTAYHCCAYTDCAVLLLQVETSHPVDLVVMGDEGSSLTPFQVPAVQGKTLVCLPGQGRYTLAPKGCYIFSSQAYPISVNPDSPTQPLKLTASRAYVNGVIRVTSSPGGITSSKLPPRIEIGTISIEPADSVVEAGVVATASQLNPESDPGVYTYTLALDLGSTVGIEPVQPDGGLLIFQPTRTRFQVVPGSGSCPKAVPDITAFEGTVVSGATEPAVAGGWSLQCSLQTYGLAHYMLAGRCARGLVLLLRRIAALCPRAC